MLDYAARLCNDRLMKQATRYRRHLEPKARGRLKFIINVIFDGLGLAVLLIMAYGLVALANDYMNGV